jgi:nucleoside-diphosphate-sugar epimerase
MQARAKIAVAGATGRVGRHVADMLEKQGRPTFEEWQRGELP